ncbi:MAG TPA: fimbria/pilus outer membrane usher protein [Scandinavium sp.]
MRSEYTENKNRLIPAVLVCFLFAKDWLFSLSLVVFFLLCWHADYACAQEVYNLKALETGAPAENLDAVKRFAENDGVIPGTYLVDIYINRQKVDHREVQFKVNDDHSALNPVLTKADLIAMGVKANGTKKLGNLPDSAVISSIADYIADASSLFEVETLSLYISVPQVAMDNTASGYVDPKLWDNGIAMLFSNYAFSGSETWQKNGNQQREENHYLNLNNGINLGAWRFRNYSSYTQGGEGWQSINTYAQRSIAALGSQVTLGDAYTNGDIFDSVQFRGVKLETDDNMRPYSMSGFAPVIHGTAQSNAQVTVKQNGYVIYQSYVSPGPFEIRDLSPISAGGDMEVTVKEADGTERSFIQATASVPIMRREGSFAYSVVGGEYRSSNSNTDNPQFGEATLIYGLSHGITLYGGVMGAEMYRSAALGMGIDLGAIGSISTDVTTASATLKNQVEEAKGQSWRMQYAKNFTATDTSLTLASYRYSTQDYYTFEEAIRSDRGESDDNDTFAYRDTNTKHRRLQVSIDQSMGKWGSFYLSGYQQDYWQLDGVERSLNAGYNTSWAGITWNVNFSHTKTPQSDSDNQFSLSVSIPLDRWLSNAWASYSYSGDKSGKSRNSVGLNGTTLKDNNLSYNIQENMGNQGEGNSANASATYRGTYGVATTGYSYDKDSKQLNYGLQGAVVIHPHGVTLSQPLGDTSVLIRVPDVAGAKISSGTGIYTDWRGYAVVPYATAFRRNRVSLDTRSLPKNTDIQESVQEVIPTQGALVLVNFDARMGARVLVTLTYHGKPVPFGATATLDNSNYASLVGDGGQVYMTGIADNQNLHVKWGSTTSEQCRADINPHDSQQQLSALLLVTAECH